MNIDNKTTQHGNLMVINGYGVLITGNAGIGKTELSLGLLDRGHSLIADDFIEIQRDSQQLMGQADIRNKPYLLIRDLGLIPITQLFGTQSIRDHTRIHLIVHLQAEKYLSPEINPLQPHRQSATILGISLPRYVITTCSQRNLPLLLEILVQQFALCETGAHIKQTFESP